MWGVVCLQKKRKCRWCGLEFTPNRHRKFYCSEYCRLEARRENQRNWAYRKYHSYYRLFKYNLDFVDTVEEPLNNPDIRVCPECESTNLFFDRKRAETTCKDCGLVLYHPYPYTWYIRVIYPHTKPHPHTKNREHHLSCR